MADDQGFRTKTMKRKNVKGLALAAKPMPPVPSASDAQIPGAIGNDEKRADTLELGIEFRLDLKAENLVVLKELGAGNGGTVSKVMDAATKAVMARKIIHVEAKKEIRKRIVRELQIMHDCQSEYIVQFYGAMLNDTGDVIMCMEYMDCGSLDSISKAFGPVRVDVLGKISEAVLGGLTYLWRQHRIMHRDIKPSNILVNSKGHIKLCDFGVSSELEGSIAETFVGTGTYMAPERIQGSPYTVKSDVWSVGLTLMELAIGKFPFSGGDDRDGEAGGPQGILDLLQQIVGEPAPRLPKSDAFPSILEDMIAKCLLKNPNQRPTPQELYESDPFLLAAKRTPVDLEAWAVSMMERQKRTSHLPQLSPTTKAYLRDARGTSSPSSSSGTPSSHDTERTPTNWDDVRGGPENARPNGSNRYSDARPHYPVRTSSASSGQNVMNLPIRPAPPPAAAPLPYMPRRMG
ncbi:MAP kinase kinase (MEK) [Coniosporium apollinis]|uniref:MAP kinase kinase (MEK) n=1 Tax=Coniosporium apollinis TaxID=61459 RepID=A0ABQ9NUA3_9PEZI|nr:MAP kinase kinase (MEK) [Coniosporium apollinis]